MSGLRFDAAALTAFARDLFASAGLEDDKAAAVATYLVDADLMGHNTHGLRSRPGIFRASPRRDDEGRRARNPL